MVSRERGGGIGETARPQHEENAPVTGSLMILLHKGQIHSDGTLEDAPIPTAAMRGEIGGDATGALAVPTGCTGHQSHNMAAELHKLTHKGATAHLRLVQEQALQRVRVFYRNEHIASESETGKQFENTTQSTSTETLLRIGGHLISLF